MMSAALYRASWGMLNHDPLKPRVENLLALTETAHMRRRRLLLTD